MADQAQAADWSAQPRKRGMQALWRLAAWGSLATVALLVAVMTSYPGFSGAGSQRQLPVGDATARSRGLSGDLPARTSDNTEETRRLMEAVRTLTADRDQAFARITALERNLDSITGSIKRAQQQNGQGPTPAQQSQAVQAAPQPPAQPGAAMASPQQEPPPRAEAPPAQLPVASEQVTYPQRPQVAAPPPVVAEANRQPVSEGASRLAAIAPAPPHIPPAEPSTAGLGLDIGGAINYEGLRTLWHSTKNSDLPLTDELYPLVAVRENGRTHGIDLRLVVGPIDDMETASRLCAELSAAHRYCQPVAFEGQRLSLNEPAAGRPARRPAAPKLDPNKADAAKPAANGFFAVPK